MPGLIATSHKGVEGILLTQGGKHLLEDIDIRRVREPIASVSMGMTTFISHSKMFSN